MDFFALILTQNNNWMQYFKSWSLSFLGVPLKFCTQGKHLAHLTLVLALNYAHFSDEETDTWGMGYVICLDFSTGNAKAEIRTQAVQSPLSKTTMFRSRGCILWSGFGFWSDSLTLQSAVFRHQTHLFFCSNLIFHHSQDPATNPICPSKPFPPNCLHGTLPDFLSLPNRMWLLNPLYERPSVCIFSVARTLPSPAAGRSCPIFPQCVTAHCGSCLSPSDFISLLKKSGKWLGALPQEDLSAFSQFLTTLSLLERDWLWRTRGTLCFLRQSVFL